MRRGSALILSLGHERDALNSDCTMIRAGIATSEILIGAPPRSRVRRTAPSSTTEPFEDVCAVQAMYHLVSVQHGTAGRAYMAALRLVGGCRASQVEASCG